MSCNKPIGIFDSGIGGITVLDDLIRMFPNEDFIYVGDTANLPYGTKDKETLKKLVSSVSNYLVSQDVKAIVIACNTATANSAHLENEIDIPVIGVIEPTSNYAYNVSLNKNILVLGTNVTINSKAYEEALTKIDHKGNYYFCRCSEFVDAIEANIINNKKSHKLVSDKLTEFTDKNIDTVILGCTHFGLYSKEILSVLPNATLIPCGNPTGFELKRILEENDLLSSSKKAGKISINATSDSDFMEKKITWFKGNYNHVNLLKI